MKAHFPPFDDPDPWVWCREIGNGSGGYLRQSECEQWRGGPWLPKRVCDLFRAIRGVTPEEMDARTQGDTVRARREAVLGDNCFPGG
jgi:hypothetical protein